MSSRATRPRSRRGRQAPPGELDPVAESSEEAEAAGGNAKPRAAALRESSRWAAAGPHLAGRTAKEADGAASAPAADAPAGTADLSVFQSLQRALSSLEAAAAAWRRRPAEGAGAGGPGPSAEQEGAEGGAREAARLAEKNAWLRLALESREDELGHMRAALRALKADKETLQREVQELQDALMRLEPLSPRAHSHAGGSGSGSSSSGVDGEPWGGQDSLSLAHPLLRRIRSDSSVHILGSLPVRPLAPEMQILEAQMEQLCGNIEKLKCFNRLLLAVLQGRKGRCESLSMRLSQREAEATALRLALQDSEHLEAVCATLLALREAGSGAGDLEAAEREAWRLLAQEEGGTDAAAPRKVQPSPEGSSVDKPTPQEVAALLQGYARRLRQRQALVKTPPEPGPTVEPMPTMPHAEAMVQAMLETQPGLALPRLEKMEIQRELVATRETLADLMLQLQLVRREKRGLELREAALRAQGPAHALLLEQLQWERTQLGAAGPHSGAGESSGAGSEEEEEEEEERPQVRSSCCPQRHRGRPGGQGVGPGEVSPGAGRVARQGHGSSRSAAGFVAGAGAGGSEGACPASSERRAEQRSVQGAQCPGPGVQRRPPEAGGAAAQVGAAGGNPGGPAGGGVGSAGSHGPGAGTARVPPPASSPPAWGDLAVGSTLSRVS